MTHDYKRNGTTSLFAAINVVDGKVHARCEQKHTHKEWLRFLKQLDRETDKTLDLHIIFDKALPISWYLVFVQVNPFTDLTD